MAGEMALGLVLLSGASLFTQPLWHLRNDGLGLEPEHILAISVPLKGTKLESGNRDALVRELLDFVRHVPGVDKAGGPVLAGVAAGMAIVLSLGRCLNAVVYGVSGAEFSTFLVAAAALTCTAVLAISIPARRASRVDPVIALHGSIANSM